LLSTAAALILMPVGFSARPASAQETRIEEIIVTTRKREENLQNIPISIVAISARQLDEQGLVDLEDIAKIVPGLTFDRSINPNDFRPAIRGLQAERGRNSVGVLIDDIDITSENLAAPGGGGLARQRLMDVERVEVVKGPQAALYGRAAFGGAINYVTKRPSLTDSDIRGTAEATSEASFQARASGGAPLVENKLGVRANAFYWNDRGSYRNNKSGAYVGGGDGAGVAGAFLAQASESLAFYGRVEYSDENFEPAAGSVTAGTTVVQFDANQNAAVPGTATSTIIFTGPVIDKPVNYDINPLTGKDYRGMDQDTLRATMIADWQLGDLAFKSLSSWVDSRFEILQDNDFVTGSVDGFVARGAFQESERVGSTRQFSQELRLGSASDSPFQWFFGGLYWEEEVDLLESNDTGSAVGRLSDADVAAFFRRRLGNGRDQGRDTYHWSGFAWGEYAVTPQVFVSLEGRYTKEDIDYVYDVSKGFDFLFLVAPGPTPGNPILTSIGRVAGYSTASIKESYFVPRTSISYRPSDEFNLYASIGKGVKPSGANTSGIVFQDATTRYNRETLWAYEIGAKTLLADRTLALNASFFYQDYKDQQVASQVFNQMFQQLQPVVENAGQSTIQGLELETNWRATEKVSLGGSYVLIDAKFDSFRVNSTSAGRIAESGCGRLVTFGPGIPPACELNKDGKRPADLPKHQVKLNAAYTDELTADWKWFAEADFRYTSRRELETANVSWQESYSLTDLRVGVSSDSLRATIFVDNVFDDKTVIDGSSYSDFFNNFAPAGFGYRPQPLTFGLRVNYTM